jgi:hypothetical protein
VSVVGSCDGDPPRIGGCRFCSVEDALGHRLQSVSSPATSQRGCVHEPRVVEEVDHLAAPAIARSPVDEEGVFDPAVDRLRVGAKDMEPRSRQSRG